LVNAQWVQQNYSHIKIFDCSWYLPAAQRNPLQEHKMRRLRGAMYFSIEDIADKSIPLPHMAPSVQQFNEQMRAFGINNNDHVVLYDLSGMFFASARAWWMFNLYGHERISILEKGLNEIDPSFIESGDYTLHVQPGNFEAKFNAKLIKYLNEIETNLTNQSHLVVDARSPERFNGTDPEVRPGLVSGHMPHSKNLFFRKVIKDGSFLPREELQGIFNGIGVGHDTNVITSCGSGVSASVLLVALDLVGHKNFSLYDGSWSEYGQSKLNLPVIKE